MSLAASKVIGANTSVLAEIMRTLSRQRSLMQPLHTQIDVKVGDLKVRLAQVDFGGEYLNTQGSVPLV